MRALNLETEGLGRERAADGVGRACQRPSCGLWGGRVTPRHVLDQLCPERAHALGAPSAVPPPHGSWEGCISVTHSGARPGRSQE